MEIIPKPADAQWTDEQWKAIVAAGQDILVAAAAGSGKTAVLVERMIRKITDVTKPIDVDNLLVVTFTNASAAEMKERIGKALEAALEKNMDSDHLRRQVQLIHRANISTLHAFCLQVIRQYYYLLDMDPKFRIANTMEIQMLMEEVMEELLEEQYSSEQATDFFDLIDRYTSDKDDVGIQDMIVKLHTDSKAHPQPNVWLDSLVKDYEPAKAIEETKYGQELLASIQMKLAGERERLTQGLQIAKSADGPAPYIKNFTEDMDLVDNLLSCNDWESLYDAMEKVKFGRLATCKKDDYNEELIESAKDIRNKTKKSIEKLKLDFFSRNPASLLEDMVKMKPLVATLVALVKDFDARFRLKKEEKGIVDFADIEHYTLQILAKPDGEKLVPTEIAENYREKFAEVLVDEYQDTNLVQEAILQLVSKDGAGNLFMVGDVKQSIYRFRLAEPGLFLHKHEHFSKDGSHTGLRIDLSQNFRSRTEVLDATNYLFGQIMGKTVGEIVYDNDAQLKLGANYPVNESMSTEVVVINQETVETEEEVEIVELEKAQLEGRFIAKRIKELMAEGFQVYDRKTKLLRSVEYRDFVILLRSMPNASQIAEELKLAGIPVYTEAADGYFAATEVGIMLNVLRIIDNPNQDIPLASVLRSPIIGMTDAEMATLRTNGAQGTFYEAMKAGEQMEKIRFLREMLRKWQQMALRTSLSNVIWQIYRDTGYYDFVGGMPGGKQRQANLRVLYDRARQYESTTFRGLFRFVRFIERLTSRGEDLGLARALGEQEDVVRMMTIHKSKGLEFPVVFLAGIGKQFNMRDLSNPFLAHKDLGFGAKYVNPDLRIAYPTLPQLAIKEKKRLESIAEEMRVLYVAMTRAEEKLIMVGTVANQQKALDNWRQVENHPAWLLPDAFRAGAKSYLDFIGAGLIRHQVSDQLREATGHSEVRDYPAKWQWHFVEKSTLQALGQTEKEEGKQILDALAKGEMVVAGSEQQVAITNILSWQYDFTDATSSSAKQSVSEIKRNRQLYAEEGNIFTNTPQALVKSRPRFMESQKMTAAEIGTAMHTVMQQLRPHEKITADDVRKQVIQMVLDEFLTQEQAENIHFEAIATFFDTWIGKKMLESDRVEKEVPFTLQVSAKEMYPSWSHEEDEEILVQGIMDCLVIEPDGLFLIDYKTDNISDKFQGDFVKATPVLKQRYALQLELYGRALEQILKQPVKGKFLYFFDGSHILEI